MEQWPLGKYIGRFAGLLRGPRVPVTMLNGLYLGNHNKESLARQYSLEEGQYVYEPGAETAAFALQGVCEPVLCVHDGHGQCKIHTRNGMQTISAHEGNRLGICNGESQLRAPTKLDVFRPTQSEVSTAEDFRKVVEDVLSYVRKLRQVLLHGASQTATLSVELVGDSPHSNPHVHILFRAVRDFNDSIFKSAYHELTNRESFAHGMEIHISEYDGVFVPGGRQRERNYSVRDPEPVRNEIHYRRIGQLIERMKDGYVLEGTYRQDKKPPVPATLSLKTRAPDFERIQKIATELYPDRNIAHRGQERSRSPRRSVLHPLSSSSPSRGRSD